MDMDIQQLLLLYVVVVHVPNATNAQRIDAILLARVWQTGRGSYFHAPSHLRMHAAHGLEKERW